MPMSLCAEVCLPWGAPSAVHHHCSSLHLLLQSEPWTAVGHARGFVDMICAWVDGGNPKARTKHTSGWEGPLETT